MSTTATGAEQVRWDLSVFYSGIADPQIDADMVTLTEMMKNFHARYKGKLAERLGEAIGDYAEIAMLEHKVMGYLQLAQSLDVEADAVKEKSAYASRLLGEAEGAHMTFFTIELVSIDADAMDRLYAIDSIVALHRSWIESKRLLKPHLLSEPVEAALTKRASFSAESWSEFYDTVESGLAFAFNGTKTLTEMLDVLTESRDADERAAILGVLNSGLGGTFAKYAAQTLYMIAGSAALERKERGLRHPMQERNMSNRIPDAVAEALHYAVERYAAPLARRHYRLKAKHLGLPTLRWSDRNAPLPFADASKIPFAEAKDIVLAAYESFSPTLAGLIRDFYETARIDGPAAKEKRSGAFNQSLVLPGKREVAFTFLNYLGSMRDVMTLAHELGHGVHGMLAGKDQGVLMYHAPIALCETASVFGEMTTYAHLKDRNAGADATCRLALIMEKVDDIINTCVRQISFSNLERRLHGWDPSTGRWEELRKLSVPELDAIWLEETRRMYGADGDVFTYENAEHLWTYVSHFHRSFYVYGYAFGELLTQSLYAQKARLGDRFEPLYLDMLRAGSTKDAVELLAPFGLDPASESFWADGIAVSLGAMVEEAEALSRDMGISV
ncbi:MAG: M3 family metallopeptidase [bacterium]|nr:M3 family metallopeptidase [bacterium]